VLVFPIMTMVLTIVVQSETEVRTIKASEFKAKCLALMDEVADTNEAIVITKHGRPVCRLVPYRERPETLFGLHRNEIEILGDIIAPAETDWEAER